MVNATGRRLVHALEVLMILTLLAFFVSVAYGKFVRAPADFLDADADPRLMVVDLVSLQQLAESTKNPHQITFDAGPDGSVRGFNVLYRAAFGDPWAVLRSRTFPKRVQVTSSLPCIEYDADGRIAEPCEMTFHLKGRRWRISLAKGTGEVRLVPIERS